MPVIMTNNKQVKGMVGNRVLESWLIQHTRPALCRLCPPTWAGKPSDLSLLLALLLILSHLDEFTRLAGPPAPVLSYEHVNS